MVMRNLKKRWNSSGKDTHAKGWQVGVRDDVGVEGAILEGSFPFVLKRILGPVMKWPM
jgi:hypothetical protein